MLIKKRIQSFLIFTSFLNAALTFISSISSYYLVCASSSYSTSSKILFSSYKAYNRISSLSSSSSSSHHGTSFSAFVSTSIWDNNKFFHNRNNCCSITRLPFYRQSSFKLYSTIPNNYGKGKDSNERIDIRGEKAKNDLNKKIDLKSNKYINIDQQPFQNPIDPNVEKLNKFVVKSAKDFLTLFYKDRDIARFYALETIARVPYFAYTSVLHLYETLGWTRDNNNNNENILDDNVRVNNKIEEISKSNEGNEITERRNQSNYIKKNYMKIHFAESWNELHHLLIMEALGGNVRFSDRFIAQHIAFFYYWIVIFVYIIDPKIAYNLNEQVERHAYKTYDDFIHQHEKQLKMKKPPQVAIDYYTHDDMYMFDLFTTTTINYNEDGSQINMIENVVDYSIQQENFEKEVLNKPSLLKGDVVTEENIGNLNIEDTEANFDTNSKYNLNKLEDRAVVVQTNLEKTTTINLSKRRPKIDNLYDVFKNIRDDELEHVMTMEALQYNLNMMEHKKDGS